MADLGGGGRLTFAVPDQLSPALVVVGRLIDPEYDLLRRIAQPGWVDWDIGAAIGQYTVFASSLAGQRVVAVEPNPALRSMLERNISLNRATDRTQVEACAISDSRHDALFSAPGSPFVGQLGQTPVEDAICVPALTLTDLADRHGDRVDVLKVNVAGYEAAVLRGGLPLFRDGSVGMAIVLVGDEVVPVLRQIAGFGYACCFFEPEQAILNELPVIDRAALRHPGSPARHVLLLRRDLLAGPVDQGITVDSAHSGDHR